MIRELGRFFVIGEAISALLYPYGEVVIHDLKTKRIAAIFNNFSKRKVGEDSLLEEIEDLKEMPDFFPPYFKRNWDGRKLKSVTVTLRNSKGKAIGLLCINLDVSKWEEMSHFLAGWLQSEVKQPTLLFQVDWKEKVNEYVFAFLKREGVTLKNLSKEKKKELILALYREGAFSAKNAAHYIADVLALSRATVYNYLRKK